MTPFEAIQVSRIIESALSGDSEAVRAHVRLLAERLEEVWMSDQADMLLRVIGDLPPSPRVTTQPIVPRE